MAACDSTELITNAAKYTARALPGTKQLAVLAYACCALNGHQITSGVKTAVTNARNKLGPLPDDQVEAAMINLVVQAANRAGNTVSTATLQQMSLYLSQLGDSTLMKICLNELCGSLAVLIP
jgi:hypothetical protein